MREAEINDINRNIEILDHVHAVIVDRGMEGYEVYRTTPAGVVVLRCWDPAEAMRLSRISAWG